MDVWIAVQNFQKTLSEKEFLIMEHWNTIPIKINPNSLTLRILQKGVITSDIDSEETFIIILEGYDRPYCKNCLKEDLPNFEFQPNLTTISVDKLAEEILSIGDLEDLVIMCTDMNLQKQAINRLISIIQSKSEIDIDVDACYGGPKLECLAENLTARELREKITTQLKNKFRFGHFTNIFPIFQSQYEKAILDLTPHKLYTIYSIICFTYLNTFAPTDSLYYDLSPDIEGHSLNSLVRDVSFIYSSNDTPDEEDDDIDIHTDSSDSHFKSYQVSSIRKLKKFFEYILDDDSYKRLFGRECKVNLTVLDYAFISYLLSNDAHNNINAFVTHQYDEIDEDFRSILRIGLYRLEHLHGLNIQKEKIFELQNSRDK